MKSEILGELRQDEQYGRYHNKNYLSNECIATPFFNGKKILYRIDFNSRPELSIKNADSALERFFRVEPDLKSYAAEKVFENWQEFNEGVGVLDTIETFRAQKERPKWMDDSLQNALWLAKLTRPEDVWEYIVPTEIIVTQDRLQQSRGVYLQILCRCAWEEEHGLQIILKEGRELIRVSSQDGDLFER